MLELLIFILLVFMIWFIIGFIFVGWSYKYKLPKVRSLQLNHKLIDFIKIPFQFWKDRFEANTDEFNECGLHLICGEQGSGKTLFATWLLFHYKKSFPKLKIKSNCCLSFEDEALNSANDLVFSNNGIYGEIDFIDEIQNWFNSLQSKDFPVEMLQEVSQQRKQHKCIYATSQLFDRVAKPIREQVSYVYRPITLFGCFTIVIKCKPKLNTDSMVEGYKFVKLYAFLHTKEIRNSYDTYKKIEFMAKGGLRQRDWSK